MWVERATDVICRCALRTYIRLYGVKCSLVCGTACIKYRNALCFSRCTFLSINVLMSSDSFFLTASRDFRIKTAEADDKPAIDGSCGTLM